MAQSGNEQSAQTIRIKLPVEMPADECSAPPGRAAPPTASLPREAVRAKLGASEFTIYREFLQSIYDAVLIADWEGHIVDGNTRSDDFFRYTTPELRAMTLGDIVRGLNSNILGSICANLDRGRFTLIEEAYCRRKDYSVFPAEIAVNKLHLGDEKQLCLFVRDITRR